MLPFDRPGQTPAMTPISTIGPSSSPGRRLGAPSPLAWSSRGRALGCPWSTAWIPWSPGSSPSPLRRRNRRKASGVSSTRSSADLRGGLRPGLRVGPGISRLQPSISGPIAASRAAVGPQRPPIRWQEASPSPITLWRTAPYRVSPACRAAHRPSDGVRQTPRSRQGHGEAHWQGHHEGRGQDDGQAHR